MEYLTAIFSSILPQLPSLFLHAVGLGFSISRRKEYPRTALAAGIYFGLSLLIGLATQVYVVLPMYMVEQGGSTQDIGSIFTTLTFICVPFRVAMDVALLYAIFAPRSSNTNDSNQPIFVGDKNG
jgi:cyanate permease